MKTEMTLGTIILLTGTSFVLGYKYGCRKTGERVLAATVEALTNILEKEADNQNSEGEKND